MSASITTDTGPAATTTTENSGLRRLYLTRTAFAVIWAGLFASTGSELGTLAAVLLVVYPAVDAIAAILDATSTEDRRTRTIAIVNAGISVVAAAGLAIASTEDMTAVLRVFGAWAVVSGLTQLAGAVSRRGTKGQRFLIASGTLSVFAGSSFAASAAGATSMTNLSGYAVLGGIFFLVSALRLGRTAATDTTGTTDTGRNA